MHTRHAPHSATPAAGRLTLAALAVACVAAVGSAQVADISIGKTRYFDQTAADTQPATPSVCGAFAYAATDAIGDAVDCTITGPGSAAIFPVVMPNNGFGQHNGFLGYHDTLALMEDAVPPGTYTFTFSGGILGTLSDSMSLVGPFLESDLEIPYITGDGFDRIQNMDPSVDFNLEINGFTPVAPANDSYSTIFIYQSCGGDVEYWGYNLAPNETSVTIPAGTLLPAREYVFTVSHTGAWNQPAAAFGGSATVQQYWQSRTGFSFFVGYDGCLADVNDDTLVDLVDFFDFLNAFDTGDPLADLNGCGGVDLVDFFLFLNAFDANDCGL